MHRHLVLQINANCFYECIHPLNNEVIQEKALKSVSFVLNELIQSKLTTY